MSIKRRFEIALDDGIRGWEWIAPYVKVRGFVSAATGDEMKLKQNMWANAAIRLGATINGNRTSRATRVEKHIVPKSVVVE